MVVHLSTFILAPEWLNVGLNDDVNKGFEEIKEEPGVNHFEVSCLWEVVTYVDKHRRQDEHHRDIERDDAFKEKFFEIIGWVPNEIQ